MIYKKYKVLNSGLGGDRELAIALDRRNGGVSVNGEGAGFLRLDSHPGSGTFVLDHQALRMRWVEAGDKLYMQIGSRSYIFQAVSVGGLEEAEEAAGGVTIRSRMPGKILKVVAESGSKVEKGDDLIVMESMKMESKVQAPRSGELVVVMVQEGDLVQADQELCQIQSES